MAQLWGAPPAERITVPSVKISADSPPADEGLPGAAVPSSRSANFARVLPGSCARSTRYRATRHITAAVSPEHDPRAQRRCCRPLRERTDRGVLQLLPSRRPENAIAASCSATLRIREVEERFSMKFGCSAVIKPGTTAPRSPEGRRSAAVPACRCESLGAVRAFRDQHAAVRQECERYGRDSPSRRTTRIAC